MPLDVGSGTNTGRGLKETHRPVKFALISHVDRDDSETRFAVPEPGDPNGMLTRP